MFNGFTKFLTIVFLAVSAALFVGCNNKSGGDSGRNGKLSKQQTEIANVVLHNQTINGIECVLVKAGTFTMGSRSYDTGHEEDETQHQVTITKDYYISKYEITQAQYQKVIGCNPSCFTDGDDLPVENINWDEAVVFCKAVGGRLPTEAEWEFAARGGNNGKGYIYSGSDDLNEVGWYYDNSGGKINAVGQKSPNELGIYDMSGNVWEWCNDWCGSYPKGSVIDPAGPDSGYIHVIRGGCCNINAQYCRVAFRSYISPSFRNLGLRVAFDAELMKDKTD